MGQIGLFDLENRLSELSEMGDPLETINRAIRWKSFRPVIDKAFRKERKSNAGRPPYDYILMFKILVLQTMYGLSDAQTQFQILDRLTFKRFLELTSEDSIPDEKTVWLFRETLTQAGVVKKLFDLFGRQLNEAGYTAQKGQIIDASFVEVPRQRNTREENKEIKNGGTPQEWEKHPEKLRQKDSGTKRALTRAWCVTGRWPTAAPIRGNGKHCRDRLRAGGPVHRPQTRLPAAAPDRRARGRDPQLPARHVDQQNGFFYHFSTSTPVSGCDFSEVSPIDTTILLCGVLMAREYFNNEKITHAGRRHLPPHQLALDAERRHRRSPWAGRRNTSSSARAGTPTAN